MKRSLIISALCLLLAFFILLAVISPILAGAMAIYLLVFIAAFLAFSILTVLLWRGVHRFIRWSRDQ